MTLSTPDLPQRRISDRLSRFPFGLRVNVFAFCLPLYPLRELPVREKGSDNLATIEDGQPWTLQPHTNPTELRESAGNGGTFREADPVAALGESADLSRFRDQPDRFPKPGVGGSSPPEGAVR